ncbi:MAG: DUF3267 domain-containing protein [Phaeodactylibacter sp.]|nr:DUF3267 domain-containing protein [Phaeodactylibacter sp.]
MTVEELQQDPAYEHWLSLSHDEILPFVQEEFGRRSWLTRFYLLLNLALLLAMILLGAWQVSHGLIGAGTVILNGILGILLTLTLLVPLHEGIHGLAYRLVGAPKVQYGSDIRKFIFYAMADHFVVGFPQFIVVALAPFLVINFFAFLAIFYVSLNYQWILLGVLLMHTGACAGDIAMLSFFLRHREKGLLTYDDVGRNTSHFYRERPVEEAQGKEEKEEARNS